MAAADSISATRTGALLTLVSITSAQLGIAASVALLGDLSALGAAWLRLSLAAVAMTLIIRPWRVRYSPAAVRIGLVLGCATAGMGVLFMMAAARLPLGTACALEFLGPFTVAAVHAGRGARQWPMLAGLGVLLLTQPWRGEIDLLGVAYALGAAVCYAGYIVFTERVGDEAAGLAGLGISLPVAAVVASAAIVLTGTDVSAALHPQLLLVGIGAAVLVPLTPYILELLALRRMSTAAFSTLLCLEPAVALLLGLVVLGQVPGAGAVVGIACVVVAGICAVRAGARPVQVRVETDPHPPVLLTHAP